MNSLDVYGRDLAVSSSTKQEAARLVANLPYGTALITDEQVDERTRKRSGRIGSRDVAVDFVGGVPFVGRIQRLAERSTLILSPLYALHGGDGTEPFAPNPLRVDLEDSKELVGLRVGSRLTPIAFPMQVFVEDRSSIAPLFVSSPPMKVTKWSVLSDCGNRSKRSHGPIEIGEAEVEVKSVIRPACASSPTFNLTDAVYRITFEHKTVRGDSSHICIRLATNNKCALSSVLRSTSQWTREAHLVRVPAGHPWRLELYADACNRDACSWTNRPPTDLTTKVYRRIAIERVEEGEQWNLKRDELRGEVEGNSGPWVLKRRNQPSTLRTFGVLSNCNTSMGSTGLTLVRLGKAGVRLASRSGSACTTIPISRIAPGGSYRLSFEHRTVRGAPARVCVWLDRADTCSSTASLPSRPAFTQSSIDFDVLGAATGVRIFMYADGLRSEETITEYRNFRVEPTVAYTVTTSAPQSEASAEPTVKLSTARNERLEFRVEKAAKTMVIALKDTADPGWRLGGLPSSARATPIVVDGYRQGWRIEGATPFAGTIDFRPTVAIRRMQMLSFAFILVLVVVLLGPQTNRRRRRMSSFGTHPSNTTDK